MKILSNSFANGVKGFKTAGIAAGLKKSCKKDLAIIYSEKMLYQQAHLLQIK